MSSDRESIPHSRDLQQMIQLTNELKTLQDHIVKSDLPWRQSWELQHSITEKLRKLIENYGEADS